MGRALRWLLRIVGFLFVLGALYPFLLALRALDRREFVAAGLATMVGGLIARAGMEFLRPESAE